MTQSKKDKYIQQGGYVQHARLSPKGKKSAPEWRLLVATFMGYVAQGLNEDEIIKEMGLRSLKDYSDIKKRMYELEIKKHIGRSNQQLFIDYIINQRACIEDLAIIIESYKESNQANALVGAVRAKSDIIDKIARRGEELGVLRKENNGVRIIAGLNVSGMTNLDIKLRIKAELQQLDSITQGPIIDVTPDYDDNIITQPALTAIIDDDAPMRCKRTSPQRIKRC